MDRIPVKRLVLYWTTASYGGVGIGSIAAVAGATKGMALGVGLLWWLAMSLVFLR